ncbi:TolC family protein [Lentiprolixibacter aurantiacus]|uniref:TolC family protein n=1 Tax=Lentiprolixibacter aurantiacus TaxID=2993939 RepID=A0AAE3SMY5_9FLAO|nr:TolC family protein [Lentiprolixibacter aurantiacus]MCX2719054.1 TolC family protein [Lentiprolixibacter aurantiacus]
MKYKLTLLLLVFGMISLSAQLKKWTLEECVTYAVENNLSIEQFRLDLENAKIDKSDAIGNLLPTLNGQLSAQSSTGLSFNPANNEPVNITQNSASGSLTSFVTLFDGLRNYNQIQRAKLNAIASQYRLDNLVDDIRLNVALNYLSVLSNKESLKVFEAQYAVTEQDLKRTQELVESGVLPRGDLLEIEATAANQEQQIINARNQVLISRINLAQLLQITDYENFDIADEEFEVPPSDILNNSAKSIFAKALSFRNDIKFSESNVALAEKDLQIAKGAALPTLGAFINYNTRYSDQFFDPFTGDLIPFKDQLWINDGISLGARLDIPIFNGFNTRNSIKRSKISLEKAKLQLEQDKLDLETNVNQAYVDVENTAKTYEASLKTLEARRLAYDYARERYNVGVMNAFDFSQAQARVDNAAASVIRSKYDYIFRIKVLEFYFGLPIVLD